MIRICNHTKRMDACPIQEVAYMHQLFWFSLQLALVAWLRKSVILKRGPYSPPQWCVEMAFGLLSALPLLSALLRERS